MGKPLRIAVDNGVGARGRVTALKCRSWRTPRYSPPVHMIKLTASVRLPLIRGCILTKMIGANGRRRHGDAFEP